MTERPWQERRRRLQTLTPSRKRLREGDVFCVLPADGRYVFGRVIEVEVPEERAPMPVCNLIYVYDARSESKDPPWESLTRDRLLIGPMFINRLPWSRGYVETVGHRELRPEDVLDEHCFYDPAYERFVDRNGQPRLGPLEPCGVWGLSGFGALDKRVHEALGMPLW